MGGLFTRYFRASSDHEDNPEFEMKNESLRGETPLSPVPPLPQISSSKVKYNTHHQLREQVLIEGIENMVRGIKFVQEKRREWWNVMENYLTSHQIEKQELMREKLESLEEEIKENQRKEIRNLRRREWKMDYYEDPYMKIGESTFKINKRKEEDLEQMEEELKSIQKKEEEWFTGILTKMEKNIFHESPRIQVEQLEQRWTRKDIEKMKEIKFREMEEHKCWERCLKKVKVMLGTSPSGKHELEDMVMLGTSPSGKHELEDMVVFGTYTWRKHKLDEPEWRLKRHQWREQRCRQEWREMMTKRKVIEFGQWYTVSDQSKLLPRYTYHQSLLNWFSEGIPNIPSLLPFKGCRIIIGGEINDVQKHELFITYEEWDNAYKVLSKASLEKTDLLIVYFVNNNPDSTVEKIAKLGSQVSLENATILYAVNNSQINDDRLKDMIKAAKASASVESVDFVDESRSEIISKMTCILERRIFDYLQNIHKQLSVNPHTQNVTGSLLEVNAILKRLKQAECYPSMIAEDAKQDIMEAGSKVVDEILHRFGDDILYHGYNGNHLYIIVSKESVKENLENLLQECMGDRFDIIIQDKLAISELADTGVPLHGAKFVFVHESSVDTFEKNNCFATLGSLMKTNEGEIVAITARHAFENKESDLIYILIDNEVVPLGKQMKQSNNKMECIEEDIATVQIEEETRSLVNENCEKNLIDNSGHATPARIAVGQLEKDDIVHKIGAKTGLTTGIVTDVKILAIGRFSKPSRVIYISGVNHGPFAGPGDSGSLVYKKSLNPEENVLEVHAMVQGKVQVPIPNPDIVCFPFSEGCRTLYRNFNHIEPLKFINQ